MIPWLDDGDVRLYHGDALAVLAALPAESVQTCVTSPPYWGLRDYGTGEWDGGDPGCDHAAARQKGRYDYALNPGLGPTGAQTQGSNAGSGDARWRDECPCGARRVDSQLGLEPSPDAYVAALVAVFREVRRVLRPDGTLWLNLGDSYTSGGRDYYANGRINGDAREHDARPGTPTGLKPKDLVGIPWRVAFALQADGWYLRSDIVWSKPNPMPESVTDRPTKAHEYVFLLSKGPRYFYDADAIREEAAESTADRAHLGKRPISERHEFMQANGMHGKSDSLRDYSRTARNARSVWTIATEPTRDAHFATFPTELVRRCILAGTSEAGECSVCGAPWQRQVGERIEGTSDGRRAPSPGDGLAHSSADPRNGQVRLRGAMTVSRETVGWAASCACGASARPQVVLDPFVGSGTTALVARRHGRRAIGVDLNADYLAIAARRTAQLSLLAEGGAA